MSRFRTRRHLLASGGGGSFTPLSAPTILGSPVVGQTLYFVNGTYSMTPDSITPSTSVGGSAVDMSGADSLLLVDIFAGSAVGYSETAVKAGNPAVTNPATSTGAVALIDLTNAITAFTRTSASGVTPMQWSITFASNVFAGYMLRLETFSDGSLMDAAHTTQNFNYQLTNDDLQPAASLHAALTAAGWVEPGATEFLRPTVYTTSPNGLAYKYVCPTALCPTDIIVNMNWSASDYHDQGPGNPLVFSNSNKTVTAGGGTPYTVRANRAVAFDLTYWEATSGAGDLGVADASLDLTIIPGATVEGQTPTTHAGVWAGRFGPSYISYNGSEVVVGNSFSNTTDIVQMALDRVNKLIWFAKNGAGLADGTGWLNGNPVTGIGGLAMASIGTMLPYAQLGFSSNCTINPGTTPGGTAGFTYTPPTNGTTRVFVAP